MIRLRRGTRLVIATHNPGKAAEFGELLAPWGIDCVAAGTLGLPAPAETAPDFAGNARIKALAAAEASQLPALADDSGIAVAALAGAPGVNSARFAEEAGGYPAAMAKILAEIRDDRRAAFVCALCLATPDGETATFQGEARGTLAREPRGSRGFGYDPIFIPDRETRSFAELTQAEKNTRSHRAAAFRQIASACLEPDDRGEARPGAPPLDPAGA